MLVVSSDKFQFNYRMVKKETGTSALEYIQTKVIDLAKERIYDRSKSITEMHMKWVIDIPNNLLDCLKQRAGMSPLEYRIAN